MRTIIFYWIAGQEIEERLHRLCIELEYEFRPKIIKFLITDFDMECRSDFSCFHFEVDLTSQRVTLSDAPLKYLQQIKPVFDSKMELAFQIISYSCISVNSNAALRHRN